MPSNPPVELLRSQLEYAHLHILSSIFLFSMVLSIILCQQNVQFSGFMTSIDIAFIEGKKLNEAINLIFL